MRLRKKHFAIPEMEKNPQVYFDAKNYKGKWKEVFGNLNPIYLEIGSGKGDFITELAKRNPDINFIAFEMETNAFVYACRKILERETKNVIAIPANANELLEYFDEDEIDRIYINFCNPWPKKRHHKRRLTYPDFLQRYKHILKKNSKIFMKTDDRDLFEATLEYMEEEKIEIKVKDFDMKLENYPDNIITEYESKWRAIDKPIHYGIFEIL